MDDCDEPGAPEVPEYRPDADAGSGNEAAAGDGKATGADGWNPDAPEFVPGQAKAAGPSLVFSGGGDFLAKYRDMPDGARSRQRRGRPGAGDAGGAPGRGGGAAPDRMNVQLNYLLVQSRSVDKILQVVDAHFDHFNAVNIITALHRLATIVPAARKGALRRDARFKRIIHRLMDTLRRSDSNQLKPQDLSNVAWALTKLGLMNAVLFGHLSDQIVRTMHQFQPVNLSMTLWAFARSTFLDEKLFRRAAQEVKLQLPEFQPQQIANTTWAMAKSGFVDEELFQAAASLALEKMEEFQPMNFSMLLYSFALARVSHFELFDKVGERCTVSALIAVPSAPHVVTNLALAYSEAGVSNPRVFEAVSEVVRKTIDDFKPQQLGTLVRAFAGAGVRDEPLLQTVTAVAAARITEFKQQELQDLLTSLESIQFPTTLIVNEIEAQKWQSEGQASNSYTAAALVGITLLLLVLLLWRLYNGGHNVADAAR